MSDILIGVIVFGLVFGAAIFGMFLGRNPRVLEQKVNASDPPSPRLRRAKQTERCGQVRPATVHHALLPIAHDVQHPVQKQGRPVPKRSLAQRWLRLLGQSAIGNRQSATAVENFASTGNRELAPMSLAEKQHCYCTNPLTHA